MKSIFFSAVISVTNEQPVKLIECDVEFDTAPLRIEIVRDPANADPTLASFHEKSSENVTVFLIDKKGAEHAD